MAEVVVSFVVESLGNLLIERFGNLLIEEAKLLHGVGGKVDQIYRELCLMQAFLRDADARQNEDERIRVWVAEIKSLAYDAGDVLESYLLGVESRKKGGFKNVLKRYVCIVDECIVSHKVSSKIDDIRTAITDLSTRVHTYGIKSLSEVREGSSSADGIRGELRRSYSHVDEDDFIALEQEVEDLVDLLVNDEDRDKYYRVVSICGMGGLGKTTIAKKVYKHARVKSHFAAFAWVCISQQLQKRDILQKILKSLIPEIGEQISKFDEEELIKKISEVQKNKKCLVVLDDIWSVVDWDRLLPAFPIGNKRSRLLLTSRNVDVVTHADPKGFHYQPRVLVDDECLELLWKKAFNGRVLDGAMDVEEMENLGRQMVKHCGGLPLAVIVLGGLLATKHSLTEWQMVHQSIRSYLRKGEGMGHHLRSGVSDILALSYNDLPYQLKPCFLYLAQFLEDSEIEAESLYQLWIAENMLLSKDRGEGVLSKDGREEGETMMNVAERYLGELAHRCMIQVQLEEDESGFRRYKSCNLHDLMRDLCMLKAKEEDFFRAVGFGVRNDPELDDSSSSSTIVNRTRRLVVCYDDEDSSSRHVSLGKKTSQHIRSLLFLNPSGRYVRVSRMLRIIKSDLKDFKLLRVLVVDGLRENYHDSESVVFKQLFSIVGEHRTIPKAIGSLIHLRYLSFSRCSFCTFPAFLTNLKHLQTLKFLKYCTFGGFFLQRNENMLRKMGRLRHLYLPNNPRVQSETTKLRLDDLCNLEVLENFHTSWCNAEDLIKLTNLRKLTARVSTKLEDLERIVHYLITLAPNCLQHSSLDIGYMDLSSEKGCVVLRQLLGCHNLHRLSIGGYLGNKLQLTNHDHHFNFSSTLTELYLTYSNLEEDPMPSLESIPNLRNLYLGGRSFVGKEIVCSAMGFSQLISLRLFFLPELEKWRVEEGALPKLSHLIIIECEKLEMLPDGLRFVTTLRELVIADMPEAFNNRVRVVDGVEGEDFYKIRHVPSIHITDM